MRTVSFLLVATLASGAPALRAADPLAFELAELDRRIRVQEARARALEDLAARQVAFDQGWKAWWEALRDLVGEERRRFEEQLAERRRRASEIADLVASLPRGDRASAWVPEHGLQTARTAAELIRKADAEIRAYRELAAEGRDRWMFLAVGWVSVATIAREIQGLEAEIASIRDSVKDGTFRAWFATLGDLSLRDVRAERARLAAARDALRRAGEDGTYRVHVPGYGPTTRREVEAAIAAAEAEIRGLEEQHARGALVINRRPYPRDTDRRALDALLDEDARTFAALEASVGDGLAKVWLRRDGEVTRRDLARRAEELATATEETRAAVAAGTYRATVFGKTFTREQVLGEIRSLEGRLAARELEARVRKKLEEELAWARDVLAAIPKVSAFDLAVKAAERTTLLAQAARVAALVKPAYEKRALTRTQREGWRDEFGKNLEIALGARRARLEYLREIAAVWFPRP